jgi:two-component system, sensor histidine kinase PdtaS
MLANAAKTKPGLGTSIVVALANQLDAGVQVSDADPGAIVSIVHRSETGSQ